MEIRRRILVAGSITAGIGLVVAFALVSVRIVAERATLRASLDRIDTRLTAIEVALEARQARLEPPVAPARRPEAGSPEPTPGHAAAPTSVERIEWDAALRGVTERLDEIQATLESWNARAGNGGYSWSGLVHEAEKPPEDLQASLAIRVVEEAEGLRVKVYWRLTRGAGGATDKDWIGLYPAEAANKDYVRWAYTGGLPSGEVTLELPQRAGWYEARYLFQSGYEAVPSPSVAVAISPPPAAAGNEDQSTDPADSR